MLFNMNFLYNILSLNRVYYGQSDNTELHFLRGVKCKEHLIKLENKLMSSLFQHFC